MQCPTTALGLKQHTSDVAAGNGLKKQENVTLEMKLQALVCYTREPNREKGQ